MVNELINLLNGLLDEKLKPIKAEMVSLKDGQKRLEEKINSIQEQAVLNNDNITIIKNDLSFIEKEIAKNTYDISKYLFNNKE